MKQLHITPIFNQSIPDVWHNFIAIQSAAMEYNYSALMSKSDRQDKLQNYKSRLNNYPHNFAYAAYYRNKMVGYIKGYCRRNCAYIDELFVLPKFQNLNIGTRLLARAESARFFGAHFMELVALPSAIPFYQRCGWAISFGDINIMTKNLTNCVYRLVPIFNANKETVDKCNKIAQDNGTVFNPDAINVLHLPAYAFFNFNQDLCAYAIDGAPVVIGTNVKHPEIIIKTMNSEILHRKNVYCR